MRIESNSRNGPNYLKYIQALYKKYSFIHLLDDSHIHVVLCMVFGCICVFLSVSVVFQYKNDFD